MKTINEFSIDRLIVKSQSHTFSGVWRNDSFIYSVQVFVPINNYEISKYLIISKFWYVTVICQWHVTGDIISKPVC